MAQVVSHKNKRFPTNFYFVEAADIFFFYREHWFSIRLGGGYISVLVGYNAKEKQFILNNVFLRQKRILNIAGGTHLYPRELSVL